MGERRWVAVYGNSLYLAGIAASLRTAPGLEVVALDPRVPTARRSLSELNPAVVVIDLSTPHADLAMALLHDQPDLVLVGVDPAVDQLLVLVSRSEHAASIADLLKVLHGSGAGPGK